MSFAQVYQKPLKPKAGYYLHCRWGEILWKIRHVSQKTGIITAFRLPGCVLKVHQRYLTDHFVVRKDTF